MRALLPADHGGLVVAEADTDVETDADQPAAADATEFPDWIDGGERFEYKTDSELDDDRSDAQHARYNYPADVDKRPAANQPKKYKEYRALVVQNRTGASRMNPEVSIGEKRRWYTLSDPMKEGLIPAARANKTRRLLRHGPKMRDS